MFCYQKNFVNPTLPVDEAQFYALVRATQWNENIDRYRETHDAALKRKLPAFIFQATFDETTSKSGKTGAWRKQAATRLTGLVVMDVDHVKNPHEVHGEWLKVHGDLKKLGILLVYITPSGEGLKIVFKARQEWGNLIDNQHEMAKVLGVEVDESCKDASRMSFICKEKDILFIDKELFTYENKAYGERFDAEYRKGISRGTGSTEVRGDENTSKADHAQKPSNTCSEIKWMGYDVQTMIDERYRGNLPCAANSNRHAESLKLASDLLILFDGDKQKTLQTLEAQSWVQEIISERGENVGQTVESAAERMREKEKKYLSQMPSKVMQEAIKEATGKTWQEITNLPEEKESGAANVQCSSFNVQQQLSIWGDQIEMLSQDFPMLKDVCKGLKKNQYPAALIVAGAFGMTLMTRCYYRFYHRPEEPRRLNSSALIIGDPASGKSFATRLFKLMAAPIIKADKVGKDAINAYREQMRTKGANKEKPKKPKVVVRVHPARTSNAQFIQDMVNAVETVDGEEMHLHMLTFDTELDNTVTVQKGGSWIDKMSLELKAFHNEEDGQAYSNNESILQDFNVYWNYVYTGTPIALKKKVNEQNFGSGLATRLTVIPLPPTNFEMMSRESTIDLESDNRLNEWAEKLDRMKGELSVQKIVDELYDWTARRMADAAENDSKADEMLLKRCAYHGLNYATPYIVMRHWAEMHQEGDYWCGEFETDEVDWKLAELIVNMQYACQRHYFGAMAEAYFDNKLKDASVNVQRRQKTIEGFNRLPEEFTSEDVMKCFGMATSRLAQVKICRLVKDHLIEKCGEYVDNHTKKAIYKKVAHMF